MKPNYCSSCGAPINGPHTPTFCPNCGEQLRAKKHASEDQTSSQVQATTKNNKPLLMVITPILVIGALLAGFFFPKLFNEASDGVPETISKSYLMSTLSFANQEDITEADIAFTHVESTVVEEERNDSPETYEVTGEYTHEEVDYTFTHEVLAYDGVYYFIDGPDIEKQ